MCTTLTFFLADSLGLLTAASQVYELQDKLNSTLETLCQQTLLNIHLQQQLLATSQPSKELKPDVTGQIILQQKKKKVPGLFSSSYLYTAFYICYIVRVSYISTVIKLQRIGKKVRGWIQRLRQYFSLQEIAARVLYPIHQ